MFGLLEWSGFSRRAALFVAALGLLVLGGWAFDVALFKSVIPGSMAMKANSALCFLLSGSTLLLRLQRSGWQRPEQGMSLIVIAIALATLGEYLFDWQSGIDQLLFPDTDITPQSPYAGRMTASTAIAFAAAGFALLTLHRPILRVPTRLAASLVILIGALALLGTLWHISLVGSGMMVSPVTLDTSLALVLLGAAILRASLLESNLPVRNTPFKTVELKVLLGFIGALLLIVFGGGLSYRANTSYSESARLVAHTQEVRAELDEFYSHLAEVESAQRAYLLTHESGQLAHYNELNRDVLAQLETLGEMVTDNPIQMHNLANLRPMVTQRLEQLKHTLAVYESAGMQAAGHEILVSKSLELMNEISTTIHMMEDVEERLLRERQASAEQTRRLTLMTMLATLLLAMGVLSMLFIAIRREMQARDRIEAYNGTHRNALLLYATHFKRATILHGLFDLLANDHHYPVCAFYAHNPEHSELVREASHCLNSETKDRYAMGEGIIGEAAKSAHSVYLNNPVSGALTIATGLGTLNPTAVLAVPVLFREQCMGVLVLASMVNLTEQDRSFIEHVATQLGVALNNLKQFSDLKNLSGQLRQRSEEISQKNLQLEEINRMKSEFLANMSHELRTPLNAIIGFSEALKDGLMGAVAENQRSYIDDIYTSGEHLLSLINDILDLAKVEAGKMVLCMETIELNRVLQNSLSMVRGKAQERQLKLVLNADAPLPEIFADMRKIKQIIYNMLSNAVKFTPEGGTVTLFAHQVEDMLEIAVTDTGIGIAPEDQARLFQPFVQIDSTLSRQFEGTGLGLVMIKRLTELHGGSAGMESVVGKGSRFWVRIPWRKEADWVI